MCFGGTTPYSFDTPLSAADGARSSKGLPVRASHVFPVILTACAAVILAAPLASADAGAGPRKVTVNPYSVQQGSSMQISATGCHHGGTVWSHGNFPQTTLSAGSVSFVTIRIFDHASPGPQTFSVKCHDKSLVATHRFTISEGTAA